MCPPNCHIFVNNEIRKALPCIDTPAWLSGADVDDLCNHTGCWKRNDLEELLEEIEEKEKERQERAAGRRDRHNRVVEYVQNGNTLRPVNHPILRATRPRNQAWRDFHLSHIRNEHAAPY